MRKLQVTLAGKWYLALTILLGVVAINSGNNVIYLIESMLLSGLILSGVLSELSISAVNVKIERKDSFASSVSRDQIVLENRSAFCLFCLEVGEWKDKEFIPIAFVPRLLPKRKVLISSERIYPARGTYAWDGLVVATMYPFGFARKLRVMKSKGERLVWPKLVPGHSDRLLSESSATQLVQEQELSEGDVRQFQYGDDPRLIVWTISALRGQWWVRQRRTQQESREFLLDLNKLDAGKAESVISALATEIEKSFRAGGIPKLVIKQQQDSLEYNGRSATLDALARLKIGRAAG